MDTVAVVVIGLCTVEAIYVLDRRAPCFEEVFLACGCGDRHVNDVIHGGYNCVPHDLTAPDYVTNS